MREKNISRLEAKSFIEISTPLALGADVPFVFAAQTELKEIGSHSARFKFSLLYLLSTPGRYSARSECFLYDQSHNKSYLRCL